MTITSVAELEQARAALAGRPAAELADFILSLVGARKVEAVLSIRCNPQSPNRGKQAITAAAGISLKSTISVSVRRSLLDSAVEVVRSCSGS